MRTLLKKGIQSLTGIANSCPYTMVGKKVVQSVRGKRGETSKMISDRETELTARVKTGRNIVLIGVFCPFFWFSLLSGATIDKVYFNAAHSGIVVAIGLVLMLKARRDLTKDQ